jgi:LacI family transcriptional regulator, gluconate utilization system Gnt-I transcriptional repressor
LRNHFHLSIVVSVKREARESVVVDTAEWRGQASTTAVRLIDVARVARVAPMTVSRALREPDKVAPATRARVAAAVEKTGYVPDLVASSLTRGRTRLVGIVVPTLTASIYAATVTGVTETLRRHGFEALIGDSGYELDTEEKLIAAFLGRRADGIVLSNVTHTGNARRLLERARVPVVETGNLTEDPIDMVVGFSNADAARDMLAHLVGRGHRTIGFIGAPRSGNPQAIDRRRAYDAAVRKHRLTRASTLAVECASDIAAGGAALDHILERNPDVSAIFAASEVRAIGALLQCQRRGVAVPGRIAIAGFNDALLGGHLVPRLTTVRVPRHEIGRRAAQMIVDRLAGRPMSSTVVDLGYEIAVRESA